jgi:hypothetical protein
LGGGFSKAPSYSDLNIPKQGSGGFQSYRGFGANTSNDPPALIKSNSILQ